MYKLRGFLQKDAHERDIFELALAIQRLLPQREDTTPSPSERSMTPIWNNGPNLYTQWILIEKATHQTCTNRMAQLQLTLS